MDGPMDGAMDGQCYKLEDERCATRVVLSHALFCQARTQHGPSTHDPSLVYVSGSVAPWTERAGVTNWSWMAREIAGMRMQGMPTLRASADGVSATRSSRSSTGWLSNDTGGSRVCDCAVEQVPPSLLTANRLGQPLHALGQPFPIKVAHTSLFGACIVSAQTCENRSVTCPAGVATHPHSRLVSHLHNFLLGPLN